jgi:hypothetical protein
VLYHNIDLQAKIMDIQLSDQLYISKQVQAKARLTSAAFRRRNHDLQ